MINRSFRYKLSIIARNIIPGVLFIAIAACKNSADDIRALAPHAGGQEDRAQDVTFIYSKDGKVKMRVSAREFVRNEGAKPPYIDMNNHLRAEFFDDSGQVDNVLTADSCRYYEAQGNVLVWDSVHIVSKSGKELNTDELVWNQSIQKFFTEKPVVIHTTSEVLYGTGMEANRDFTWYRILHPTGTVQVNKGEVPQ